MGRYLQDRAAKRAMDVLVSAVGLLVCAPVMALTAVAVCCTSRGPALYRAHRVGQMGRGFTMYKFRTMVVGADRVGPAIVGADDPRVTPLGRVLRLTKLDELPQLWNVLIGDMSLVGPRPNVPSLVDQYTPEEREVLRVPQGVTDWSSLFFRHQDDLMSGSEDVMHDYKNRVAPVKIALGRYYARHATVVDDIRIVLATAAAVLWKADPMWCFPRAARQACLHLTGDEGAAQVPDAA